MQFPFHIIFVLDSYSRKMTNISEKQFEWLQNVKTIIQDIISFENNVEFADLKISI